VSVSQGETGHGFGQAATNNRCRMHSRKPPAWPGPSCATMMVANKGLLICQPYLAVIRGERDWQDMCGVGCENPAIKHM
jgi:hypothetical protein